MGLSLGPERAARLGVERRKLRGLRTGSDCRQAEEGACPSHVGVTLVQDTRGPEPSPASDLGWQGQASPAWLRLRVVSRPWRWSLLLTPTRGICCSKPDVDTEPALTWPTSRPCWHPSLPGRRPRPGGEGSGQ